MKATSKVETRSRRAAQAAQYAPRAVIKPAAPKPAPVDLRLRRITTQVLDELKKPGAIPSAVIYAALEQAASKQK